MQKVYAAAARVFTHKIKNGGNPVTVFLLPATNTAAESKTPNENLMKQLAQKCEWESVVVAKTHTPTLFFYMPSGEQVSFCAHAAMGAAAIINQKLGIGNRLENDSISLDFQTGEGDHNQVLISSSSDGNATAELKMKKELQESQVDFDIVSKLLNEVGLDVDQDVIRNGNDPFLNSSVARYKTLIPIVSMEKLHSATNPKDPDLFRDLCDAIDSTGIYLYSKVQSSHNNQYEARQFPRASGYSEDPATGIAAAALVCSLEKRNVYSGDSSIQGRSQYIINQGTAMKKNSRCNIALDDQWIYCSGVVEVDNEYHVELD